MALNAAAHRAIELTSYTPGELVNVLRTTNRRADFDAVALVLSARERRADQAEGQLKAALADALSKVQASEDLRRSSFAEAEDSARPRRIAEEEAHDILMAAVSKIHEAGKKKQDEVSAHLDAVLDKIHALRKWQQEDFPATMAIIVEETKAKLKASFSKIHAPLKKPDHDAVPSHETPDRDVPALTLGTPSIPVAHQSKQPVVEMVSEGGRAAAEGSVGKSLKRKADAVENRGVSPLQISAELQETIADIGVPPGFSPTPRYSSSPCSYSSLTQAIKGSAKVSKAVASVEGSGKAVTLKEPTPLVENGEGRERNAPSSEATQDEQAEEPAHLGGASMSLITVPVQEVDRLDRGTVSKRGRGRGRGSTVRKEKEKMKKVSGGRCSHGSGGGRGISTTSGNPVLGARPDLGQSQSRNLNRRSPVLSARPVLNCSANASQSRNDDLILPSNASATAQAKMNIASGQAIAVARRLLLEDIIKPRSSTFRYRINNTSGAQIGSIPGMGSKVTENLGKCVENKADSVPVIDYAAEGTSYEGGDVGSNDTGASRRA